MNRHFLSFFPYLATATLVTGALGCTPPAVPPAVGEADAVLERHDTKAVAAARPRLVAEARELSRRARDAAEKGDTERATLLARQAVQKLQTAKNFAEREQAERMLAALEKGGARTTTRDEGQDVGGRTGAREAMNRATDARDAAARAGARPSSLTEGDEVLRAAKRAFDSETWDRARAHANEATSLFESATGRTGDRDSGGSTSFRALAERSLVSLALRRGELLGQLRDQSCAAPFREFEAVLELGQRRFDAGDYERAYEFSLRAEERLRVCDPRSAPQTPVAMTKREADEEAARKKATASLQKAQIELSRVQAQNREDPAAIQGQALLQSGDTWYARHAYAEANDLATRAYAVLSRVKAAPPSTPNLQRDEADEALSEARLERDRSPDSSAKTRATEVLTQAERLYGSRSYGEAKSTAKRATDAFRSATRESSCEAAKVKVAVARDLEKRLASSDDGPGASARRTAQGDLASAEKKLAERACSDALVLAERGRASLAVLLGGPETRVRDGGGVRPWDSALMAIKDAEKARDDARTHGSGAASIERGDVAMKTANLAYAREEFSDAERAAREARDLYGGVSDALDPPIAAALARAEEYLTKQGPSLASGETAAPGYRGAYSAIFRALATREDAERESPEERERLAQGDAQLSAAKDAWQKRAFAEAERRANAAIALFGVLAKPTPEEIPKADLERLRGQAEASLSTAGALASACDRARCEERDPVRAIEARKLFVAARRALASRRPRAARALAQASTDRWLSTLDKPRKGHEPPKPDTDAQRALASEADAALRDADAARHACEARACDPTSAHAARDAFVTAKVARVDGSYESSTTSAREAEKLFRGAVIPVFEIPPQVREITRAQNHLVVTPPLAFKSGQRELQSASDSAVGALARTLSDNTRALRGVRIVVASDNPKSSQSQKLAEGRAEALRTALVFRGVAKELIRAEAAQDSGPPGQVDVVLELVEGVK